MARRKATGEPAHAVTAEELRWRLSWLVRSTNPAVCDTPHPLQAAVFGDVSAEAARLERAGLPLAEQVAGLERFLAAVGALGRAERMLAHLSAARARQNFSQPPTERQHDPDHP